MNVKAEGILKTVNRNNKVSVRKPASTSHFRSDVREIYANVPKTVCIGTYRFLGLFWALRNLSYLSFMGPFCTLDIARAIFTVV